MEGWTNRQAHFNSLLRQILVDKKSLEGIEPWSLGWIYTCRFQISLTISIPKVKHTTQLTWVRDWMHAHDGVGKLLVLKKAIFIGIIVGELVWKRLKFHLLCRVLCWGSCRFLTQDITKRTCISSLHAGHFFMLLVSSADFFQN